MMNFAVAGGTSGHFLGAALATILLGPWAACLVLTSVLAVQALLFQDGGLIALGANIFNMGIVGVAVAWAVYHGLKRLLGDKTWATFVSAFAAAWLSVVIASLAAAELAISGTSPWVVALPAMGLVHMLIGIGEGLITVGVLAFLRVVRPDLLALPQAVAEA
jgi:cobalt/nickel transport system permease protein